MRYFFLCILSVIILFVACSKNPKVDTSAQNILRTGKWKLSTATVAVRKPNGLDTTLNYLLFIPTCYLDDYLVFDSLNYGQRFTGSDVCTPADPVFYTFSWSLGPTNTTINLYNGFNDIYGIVDTIQPFQLDTLSKSPYLVVDTIAGALDTIAPPKILIELDTVRTLDFSGVAAGIGSTGTASGGFDIYNAAITNLSSSSFTLHFQMISYYNDSTNWHGASYLLPLTPTLVPDPNPDSFAVTRPDTFNYTFTYTNF